MRNQTSTAILLVVLMLVIPISSISTQGQTSPTEEVRTCEITADWDLSSTVDGSVVDHSYRVSFHPPLEMSDDPTNVDVTAIHYDEDSQEIGSHIVMVAGGVIDVQMSDPPRLGDSILLDVRTSEANCDRSFEVTIWNQPSPDHEITRETSWSIDSDDDEAYVGVHARGWQQRQGSMLSANELGNGTIQLLFENEDRAIHLGLDINNAWINESWNETKLIRQTFQLQGSGSISIELNDELNAFRVNGTVREATYIRVLEDGVVSEHLFLEANGSIHMNSNESERIGLDGEVSLLRFEVIDIDGERIKQDLWIEARASALIEFGSDMIEFELDEFIFRETWENSSRILQHLRFLGDGRFDVLFEDENGVEIVVNGTIDKLHTEQIDGRVTEDTLLLDGTYAGSVSGSFGSVRQIENSGKQMNSTGVEHDVIVIRDEYWFNVSGSQVTVPGQSLYSEHNLTFEYMTPEIDWESPIIRYRYVEDDGTVNNEFPSNSPTILAPTPPESIPVLSSNVSRESGLVPDVLVEGDQIDLIQDGALSMRFTVIETSSSDEIDGHTVNSAKWIGDYPGGGQSSGTTVNEGILAGLIISCTREIQIDPDSSSAATFMESQTVDRVLTPSVITAAENTPPKIVEVSYREAIWESEGGEAHIEIVVDDPDTDITSVAIDLDEAGLGYVQLSDSGLNGDHTIHDDVWTAKLTSEGQLFGIFNATIYLSDIWVTVSNTTNLELTNPGPRVTSLERTPSRLYRGEQFSVGVTAEDQHGISEIYIDLRQYGGEKVNLVQDGDTWISNSVMPPGVSPGETTLSMVLIDNFGGRTITSESPTGDLSFQVLNEHPHMGSVSLSKLDQGTGEFVSTETITLSGNGQPATHTLQIEVNDPDGVSVVQAKLGRLAPIGSSEKWLTLSDDGQNGDKVLGDGIYTIQFEARPTLGPGQIEVQIRAFDIYQSVTPLLEQAKLLTIEEDNSVKGSSWFADNMQIMAVIMAGFVALIGAGLMIRAIASEE